MLFCPTIGLSKEGSQLDALNPLARINPPRSEAVSRVLRHSNRKLMNPNRETTPCQSHLLADFPLTKLPAGGEIWIDWGAMIKMQKNKRCCG